METAETPDGIPRPRRGRYNRAFLEDGVISMNSAFLRSAPSMNDVLSHLGHHTGRGAYDCCSAIRNPAPGRQLDRNLRHTVLLGPIANSFFLMFVSWYPAQSKKTLLRILFNAPSPLPCRC